MARFGRLFAAVGRLVQQSKMRPIPVRELTCYAVLAVVFAAATLLRMERPLWLGISAAGDAASSALVEQRLDPNTAGWAELATLPGIGEALAKRVVEYRESRRVEGVQEPILRTLSDLDPVNGLGRRLLSRIGGDLKFPAASDTAEPR